MYYTEEMTMIQAMAGAAGVIVLCAALAKLHERPVLAGSFWIAIAFGVLTAMFMGVT